MVSNFSMSVFSLPFFNFREEVHILTKQKLFLFVCVCVCTRMYKNIFCNEVKTDVTEIFF